jgi:hypothetical protein
MRDKAHDELAVTVTTDPSETTTRALDHDPETAARVLLRTRLGRLTAPARGALPPPQPEQRLGGNEDTGWAKVGGPGGGNVSARAAHQSSQEVRSVPSLP